MISDRIDEYRRKKLIELPELYGKTQKEFCESIDISPSYYSRLVSGDRRITDKTILKIATKLDIPLSDFDEEDSVSKQDTTPIARNVYEDNCYYQFERIIRHGGVNDKTHMKNLLDFLIGLENALDMKQNYKDISSNEDTIVEKYLEMTLESFLNLT